MKPYSCALLAALAAGTAAQEYAAMTTRPAILQKREPVCVEDSCLQAVQASAFCTCVRLGSQDCASYFSTTLTPDLVTEYSTTYAVYTSSSTKSVTITTVIDGTATTIVQETTTATVTATSTATISPTAKSQKRKREVGAKGKLKKRSPVKRAPYYAKSACAGEAEYASACACVGVYPGVTYAPTPTTTIVATMASYSPTETDTATGTDSETTTVATATLTTAVSTATATSTAVAQGPFLIRATSQSSSAGYYAVGKYADIAMGDAASTVFMNMLFDASDTTSASLFYIDPQGYLRSYAPPYRDYYWSLNVQLDYGDVTLLQSEGSVDGYTWLGCSITPRTNVLECGGAAIVAGLFRTCGDATAYFADSAVPDDAGCAGMVVVAVPYEPISGAP